jgi:phosphoenolpyruvate carboxylase
MPIVSTKEGVCISNKRKFPSTSATQFPDNASRPFWSFKDTVSASDDFFDCYVAFKELNCHEYMWEWQDRKLDELLVNKLVKHYRAFFKKCPIGKGCFLTFKVNSPDALEKIGRLYMSVISSNDFAQGQGMFTPPLFEVIHPSTSTSGMFRFSQLYNETVGMASEKLEHDCGPKILSVIPTHVFSGSKWYTNLNSYFAKFQSSFRCRVDYFRPLIPRSSTADSVGFIAATLATKRALSSYASFSKITGIDSRPIIDAGPLLFRGGLNPGSIDTFTKTYQGARTVTLTSAFRYDYELDDVKRSVSKLNRLLPHKNATTFTQDDLAGLLRIEKIFARNFQKTMKSLPELGMIADEVKILKRNVDPRLHLTFALYSLGIPPEFIGTGKAILECIKQGLINDLERFYPNIKQDLKQASALLNSENLRFLAKTDKAWKSVLNDVKLVEDYTDASLGPDSTEAFLHRNHTSNVFHLWSTNRDFSRDLLAAARLRHCLG